jgi:hypothetical protein
VSVPARLFHFVQVEVPWRLGPGEGRYLMRRPPGASASTGPDGDAGRTGASGPGEPTEPTHVLVLTELGAPERRSRLSRRRPVTVDPEPPPTPVPTTRATIIDVGTPLADAAAGTAWLAAAGEAEVTRALVVLNRLVHAQRIATVDPAVHPVAREHALAVRVGFGNGDRVADGRWAQARELPAPAPRRRRAAVLEPQARVAGLIGGRDEELIAEELALRARADLEAGRPRQAALGLLVGLDAAIAELAAGAVGQELALRLAELRERREPVGAAAQAALHRELEPAEREAVSETLGRVEAALRARLAAPARPPAR